MNWYDMLFGGNVPRSPSGNYSNPYIGWNAQRNGTAPSPGNMARGRQAERAVPELDLSFIRRALATEEAQRNAPPPMDPMGTMQGGASVNPYNNPSVGAPAPGIPLPPQRPAGLPVPQNGAATNPYLQNPKSGAAATNDPNSLTPPMNPLVPKGGALSGNAGGAIPLPPVRPPELGGAGGQPSYYTMDPGDGGILKTFMSKDGKIPEIPGMTINQIGAPSGDVGILGKLLRGVF